MMTQRATALTSRGNPPASEHLIHGLLTALAACEAMAAGRRHECLPRPAWLDDPTGAAWSCKLCDAARTGEELLPMVRLLLGHAESFSSRNDDIRRAWERAVRPVLRRLAAGAGPAEGW